MNHIQPPSLLSFAFQAIALMLPFLVSYVAYRWLRYPEKRERVRQSLLQLGINRTDELESVMNQEYNLKHYVWPLFALCALAAVLYSTSHPYVLGTGLWVGIIEEVVNIFNNSNPDIDNILLAGRFMFWGWLGAYIYAFSLIYRRFQAYDLTPMVYIYAASRFLLAFVLGGIVGLAVGTLGSGTLNLNNNLVTVSVVVFFIGFFPEQGLDWISAFSKRVLGVGSGVAKETRLSELEGLSIWHQGRLQQEGIENVQNMATTYVPSLIVTTPFALGELVDWVDQAILLVYANDEMYHTLETAGIRCASDFLTVAGDEGKLDQLAAATGLDKNRLCMLCVAVQSAVNVRMICRYKWSYSMDEGRRRAAQEIAPETVNTPRRTQETRIAAA